MDDEVKKPAERLHVDGYTYVLEGPTPEPARNEVELRALVGLKHLDAVDFANERRQRYTDDWEDCQVCRFRLDGKVYLAIEDPSDGYRSHLASLSEYQDDCPMENVFPAVQVLARHRAKGAASYHEADVLELIDVATGKTVLEVGTDNSDDYYPSFVASFSPENMVTNKDVTTA
jgi:hypothetical protein